MQLKQEAFVKAAQSRSRHLSFKTNAKLAVTYLWHHNGDNETILQVQVNINLVFYPLDLSDKICVISLLTLRKYLLLPILKKMLWERSLMTSLVF